MTETATVMQTVPAPAAPKMVKAESMTDRIQKIHDEIARRAFELFEQDGWLLGRDLDHWFKAEAELLHPCSISISEADNVLNVEAEVPGFDANELEISLEPGRLTISGKKETKTEQKKGTSVYEQHRSHELLRVVDFPAEVDTSKATAELKNGVLTVKAPKAQQSQVSKVEVKAA